MKTKKKKIVALMLTAILAVTTLTGCTDNFNVIRRLTVWNARSDRAIFELVGAFSFTLEENRIIAIVETGPNEYKKHSVGLNEWTLWTVEDISGADVDKYHYEVNFLPEMIVPITFTSKD